MLYRVLFVVLAVFLAACGQSPNGGSKLKYDTEVVWTELGIPHIKAKDYGSLGYGMGYAFAEDNLCMLMEDIITIRGERSLYFGRNGDKYRIWANGATASNVNSDFFWKHVATDTVIANLLEAQSQDIVDAVQGYADGFNRYIRELKAGDIPGRHLRCAAEPWLQEISLNDMVRRIFRLSVLASSSVFVNEIGSMQPPVPSPASAARSGRSSTANQSNAELSVDERQAIMAAMKDRFPFTRELPFGSNMYALSGDMTQNGENLQFVNPHFPWFGTERLHLSHLILEGDTPDKQANIMGSSLHGVPAILIGFNDKFAWSHTVSTAYRFTIYELTLVPGLPTQYSYDGGVREMEATEYSIDVMEDSGEVTQETRTLYRTHFGPIMNLFLDADSGTGAFNWTASNAYAIRDANAENTRLMEQFFRWNKAKSLAEFEAIQDEVLGVPWVNTTATGPGEHVYYSDVTVVPNTPDAMVQSCPATVSAAVAQLAPGLPVLNGSSSDCEWRVDTDAPQAGTFGPSNLPNLIREDWVHNCNDSYWLTNPAEPVTGFAAIIGDEETARSLRTRKCIRQIQQRADGSDGRTGTKFTRENLKEIVLSSEIYTEELARDTVIQLQCTANPTKQVTSSNGPVDVTEACEVLSAWDGTTNIDAVGGHLWREFWIALNANTLVSAAGPWSTGFSTADPVNTPNTLNSTLVLAIGQALGDAVNKLSDAGVALDAELGDIQWTERNGEKIPVFGDGGNVGAFTIAVGALNDDGSGYGPLVHGNSYVQVIGWGANGVPEADAFITYSQSTDESSPHFADFTQRYSDKNWKRLPYTEAQIQAEKIRELHLFE